MELLNNSLKECVKNIRFVCYRAYDNIISELINSVKEIPSITYYEDLKRDQFIVSLPLSDMKTNMFYPLEDKGISFKELLSFSNKTSEGYREQSFNLFLNTLEKLNKQFDKNKILT